ncbi:polyketide cyclase [Devosia nitrariae]|uniref:Polyketide cyclase n=1 Tax=Devosia nitrariae TaxID=2071872 RepID=A0ABQ5WC50_9HYPH|nr:polyketide cyclase [Devosia nitrariae]
MGSGEATVIETIVIIVILAVVAVAIYAASKPNRFRMERSIVIDATAERVFPLIADFHKWPQWSPWESLDPELKRTYSGAAHGVGAIYAYEGNSKVGSGRMEITETVIPSRVVAKLDFIKPFEAHNFAEWTLTPDGKGTRVTWAMHGPQNFLFKLMGLVFNMDKTVGADFERGLTNLKQIAESGEAA